MKCGEGFRFWDLVMPLFLSSDRSPCCSRSPKFKDNPDKGPVYRKIIKRFILLFIFGMIVQAIHGLDPKHLYLYSNTKPLPQAI